MNSIVFASCSWNGPSPDCAQSRAICSNFSIPVRKQNLLLARWQILISFDFATDRNRTLQVQYPNWIFCFVNSQNISIGLRFLTKALPELSSESNFVCHRQESNLYRDVRSVQFYPLNYGGKKRRKLYHIQARELFYPRSKKPPFGRVF